MIIHAYRLILGTYRVCRVAGYGRTTGKGAYSRDYTKTLADAGYETIAQLQFATPELLQSAGVLPGHTGELCARMIENLSSPPITTDPTTGKPRPVHVFICPRSPPQVRDVNPGRMSCDLSVKFDAVWHDPRLMQHLNPSVKEHDPVSTHAIPPPLDSRDVHLVLAGCRAKQLDANFRRRGNGSNRDQLRAEAACVRVSGVRDSAGAVHRVG